MNPLGIILWMKLVEADFHCWTIMLCVEFLRYCRDLWARRICAATQPQLARRAHTRRRQVLLLAVVLSYDAY